MATDRQTDSIPGARVDKLYEHEGGEETLLINNDMFAAFVDKYSPHRCPTKTMVPTVLIISYTSYRPLVGPRWARGGSRNKQQLIRNMKIYVYRIQELYAAHSSTVQQYSVSTFTTHKTSFKVGQFTTARCQKIVKRARTTMTSCTDTNIKQLTGGTPCHRGVQQKHGKSHPRATAILCWCTAGY